MRNCLLLLVFVCITTALSGQEGYIIDQTQMIPKTYYVGDRVEVRLRITLEPGKTIKAPLLLPETEWVKITDIKAAKKGDTADIRVFFTSYYPGIRTLPEIILGDVVLDSIKINTASLIEDGTAEFASPRTQVYVPTTPALIAIILLILIGGPIIIIKLVQLIRKYTKILIEMLKENAPQRNLFRTIKRLKTRVESYEKGEFYSILSGEVRKYLSHYFQVDCISATTSELSSVLGEKLDKDHLAQVLQFFEFGDMVKFAHKEAPSAARTAHLILIEELAMYLEKGEKEDAENADT